ncbi:hypothetical protein [Tetragenococcus muriaticus]|uniref:Excisionase n=1 Tax=Tetragenococcus muriaticus 3MR10-3 TaxID=1302648 RepID=A0A091CDI5_9ENTE|nr:hypothetical protein [Tetragenococcus muriaticus]KFN92143.1 hypothetical protein TMU3MR103_0604 [Tetragenococcus muriaticus 3MR10-3]
MEITKVTTIPQKWMEKSHAMKYFGLDERKPYFQSLLKEFKNSEFADGYLSPTYKVVLIDIDMFEEFLRNREERKFR